MHMLTYAAKESRVGVTSNTCDMHLVAAAKDGDHQAYEELLLVANSKHAVRLDHSQRCRDVF